MIQGIELRAYLGLGVAAVALAAVPAAAQTVDETFLDRMTAPDVSQDADPVPEQPRAEAIADSTDPQGENARVGTPVVQEIPKAPVLEPIMHWPVADANRLLAVIDAVGSDGLIPADYKPRAIRDAIAAHDVERLDKVASKSFAWLVEDMRDGRTPVPARVQWFAEDPDQDKMPTAQLMARALTTHDIAGVIAGLAPTHPDYAALKTAYAATPKEAKEKRALIRANMDRWRWLARDMGDVYLITNVPEYQLRLTVNDKIIRHYRTVVGKPGRTATPQLAETVSAVVFNPTWTVPQSIVKGEGLGNKVLNNPGWARANGYKATRAENGYISVVQAPGPGNALGLMKIDMPNRHAIYFHDTPSKSLFNRDARAFSHGCIRTERAVELGMTMAILGAKLPAAEAAEISRSREYTKVDMERTFPAYIVYMTYATDIDGSLRKFDDIYGRDKPVIDSFAQPRAVKTSQRVSDEPIIELDNPL